MMHCTETGFDPFTAPRTIAIADARARVRVAVGGVITGLKIGRWGSETCALEATITDGTGSLPAGFLGRTQVGGVEVGRHAIFGGTVIRHGGRLIMLNPYFWLHAADEEPDRRELVETRLPSFV